MKLYKYLKYNKIGLVLLGLTTLFISCDEYLDVDTDKDNPETASLNLLLTSTQIDLSAVADYNLYSGTVLQVYTHQMTTREQHDQYATRVDNTFITNDWENIFLTLTNIEALIKQATETENLIYAGIGQVQKAYLYSAAVDLWGDVPFSEANQLNNGIISPKFDNQKDIYDAVFKLLDDAKTNLVAGTGELKPGKDDLFYNGNVDKWIKFCNTLKLKLYNQTRLAPNFDQSGFDALVSENNFFKNSTDDFQFNHYNILSPSDHRNRFFVESYMSTQFGSNMSPWFYEILKGMNPKIHTSNSDPRLPYYFFNQLKPNQFPPDQGIEATGDPRADYWDKSTGFFSIRFGSTGPNKDFSVENSVTYPGIYPAGGRYDDGLGGNINTFMASGNLNQPTGIAPKRILTYDEFLFIKAELVWSGKIAGDPTATLKEAIEANFKKIDEVVLANKPPQTVPILSSSANATTFVNKIIEEYNVASTDKKLEIIMTQKWVATFGDPLDQYNDYRRTGYPVLANPNSSEKEYQLDNQDDFPLKDSETTQGLQYQQSLYWPQSELNSNQNAPTQKDPTTYKIFWSN